MKYLRVLFLLVAWSNQTLCQSVLYGERENNNDNFSLYLDKDGTIYPDYFIPDNSLQKSNSSLRTWYKDNPEEFRKICFKYGLQVASPSDNAFEMLQDSIIGRFIANVDTLKAPASSLTFLIHGFRKPFKETDTDYSSKQDYVALENSLQRHTQSKFVFVEIYWDGYYDCCISKNIKKNKAIFGLFEDAHPNAEKAGNTLRKVFKRVRVEQINIVSHSLGALVAVESIFNYKPSQIGTPSARKVDICLIAPAIAGIDVFQTYYSRNTTFDFKAHDNYQLAVAYNENDFVLKKKFKKIINWGPGPYKYGNTTLGCNYDDEADKLEEYFKKNYPGSYFELIDLSNAGTCHFLGNDCYSRGNILQGVAKFLEK